MNPIIYSDSGEVSRLRLMVLRATYLLMPLVIPWGYVFRNFLRPKGSSPRRDIAT